MSSPGIETMVTTSWPASIGSRKISILEALRNVELDAAQSEAEKDPEVGRVTLAGVQTCASRQAVLTWTELNVTAKTVKGKARHILQAVTGYCVPGHLLAIMGPSGSGKTTLLDTLAGRISRSATVTGQVLLNGHKSRLSYGASAYVTQSEMLIGTLSVRETLTFAATLRLPKSAVPGITQRVDDVLKEMGLEDCEDTKIGNWHLRGISGGQRRRVAIGVELLTQPTLMFLDEPTSGLDAASAFYVMRHIKGLARAGRTLLAVIHQPSSEVFEALDMLCLLAEGRPLYFGPAADALAFFEGAGVPCPERRNPADHFLHSINQDFQSARGGELQDIGVDVEANVASLTSRYNAAIAPDLAARTRELSAPGVEYEGNVTNVSWMSQCVTLTKRTLLNNWRNVGVYWMRLVMYVLLCLCVGTIYYKSPDTWAGVNARTALLFFVVAFLTFMSISGFPAFVEDMHVFLHERLNGWYGVVTFAVANTLASAPFIYFIAITSSAIVYWLAGLNDTGDRFPYFFITLGLALLVVESLMMAIAAVVPHYLMGIAAGAGACGLYMLVCGFFQPVSQLPKPVWLYPFHYISFHSYAFAGFMHNEFDNTVGWGCPCQLQAGGCAGPCSLDGQQVLDAWSIDGTNKWIDVAILAGMVIGYRAIFTAALKAKEWMSTK